MENKKLNIKHGVTLKDTFIAIIVFVVCFGVMLTFITSQAKQANVVVDPAFNASYAKLVDDQTKLQGTTDNILSALGNVSEAKIGDFAYFGLKGMWAVFSAPLQILNIGTDAVGVTTPLFGFIPPEIKGGVILCIIGLIIFAGIRFATSRNNDP